MNIKAVTWLTLILAVLLSCSSEAGRINKANRNLGSRDNPIKMYFVPSLEAGKIVNSAEGIAAYLHQATGLQFKVAVPTSYAAVIEALGNYQADIAWLSTYAYILAKQKFDAEVKLMTVRNGLKSYRGQFVVRADSGIERIEDIAGKVIAYTDAASTSGYIYPSAILKQKGIAPQDYFFAGGHTQAILAVYSGRADVACTYWSPPDETGKPKDAREKLLETYPDIFSRISIIGYTDWIPNDTVTFRKHIPVEIRDRITGALLEFATIEQGRQTLKSLYDIDGLEPASDADYEIVRTTLRLLDMDPAKMMK
ncbi:MAG: phosphate/phosphite/phosphonate ABC transporter substrate-binding protein [Candidatus Cloacimonetes bacterium]|nr:phosphate/phosphite/phosphonate ABC transporter substrate-binding protein [Candidatus Cloacimonadota bacterium]